MSLVSSFFWLTLGSGVYKVLQLGYKYFNTLHHTYCYLSATSMCFFNFSSKLFYALKIEFFVVTFTPYLDCDLQ